MPGFKSFRNDVSYVNSLVTPAGRQAYSLVFVFSKNGIRDDGADYKLGERFPSIVAPGWSTYEGSCKGTIDPERTGICG